MNSKPTTIITCDKLIYKQILNSNSESESESEYNSESNSEYKSKSKWQCVKQWECVTYNNISIPCLLLEDASYFAKCYKCTKY